ncbi:hypothetical protein [Cohaesibacter gelatinilyticus]|uniref:Uncharacterized protein n=1 Tax=Cohaesibacter gelatinilyticus TaxID=372072 RepID=A0A285PM37_9HYPH|nr:hypothetical protein [Cohaesibacter gelatinilyticus]SNZ20951.1 hypothetical protein SAMN06265368_4065 [Cohaesibacter gelatinilyticus]
MVARPGRLMATFTAGELDPLEIDRTELKYFNAGALHVENVEIHPQGGFTKRGGLRHVVNVDNSTARLIPFKNSAGSSFEIALRDGHADVIDGAAITASFALPFNVAHLPEITWTHRQDTMFLFHEDVQSVRVINTDSGWSQGNLPYEEIPNYDYGGNYTNGEPAEWELQFVGFSAGDRFRVTVSGQDTTTIDMPGGINWDSVATLIKNAILELPNVAPGLVVTQKASARITIRFEGKENQGDGWAISGTAINKADAAIPAYKIKVGLQPGEPIISATRGWPRCGMFFQQRFFAGGFKSRGNNWMTSIVGRYFTFDTRLDEANGAFVVPLDSEGGEKINHIVPGRNMLVFTSEREYWISERTIDKTKPTVHVEASTHGTKPGVPVVKNEGAAIFVHKSGSVISEFRYTDVDGNFVSQPISILSPHLFEDVTDMAMRRAKLSTDANMLGVLDAKGRMRAGFLLRQQDVTGFGRITSQEDLFRAISVNGRDEMAVVMERNNQRRLERFERGLLLDAAKPFTFPDARSEITGLEHLEGRDVWVLGDGDVYGPCKVLNAKIQVPTPVQTGEVGLFAPPKVTTLPPPRDIGPKTVLRRQARIHSVWVSVVNTTSLAIAANGEEPVDVPLRAYDGNMDKPELDAGYTGMIELRGLKGFAHEPTVTITQTRPGRLAVRSITIEAKL